jgi:vancomycin resistance protein YoaR
MKNTEKVNNEVSKPKGSEEYIEQMMKKRQKTIKIAVITVVVIIVLLIALTAFAIPTMFSNKIISGVSIGGINVSGLDKAQAVKLIEEKVTPRQKEIVKLKYGEYEKELPMEQLEVTANIEKAVDEALSKGRAENIFSNNFAVIASKFRKQDIGLEINYNEGELEEILTEIGAEIPGRVQDYTYNIEENELIITKGKDGVELDVDKMKNDISDGIKNISKEFKNEREISVKEVKAGEIDIEKIYNEVHTEPQDAYIVEDPFQVVVDKDGVDFAITMDEAKTILAESKEEYSIPLKITKAQKTVASLGSKAFPDLLGTFTTRYDAGNVSRTTNLAIACKKLNGQVIQPGEVFSYNKALGKRSVENGYKEAAVYVNGGVENGLGGGICQISSTLYNTVLFANLGIVERHQHSFTTSYVDPGRDATVVYGALDFKFKNTRKYPVKLEAYIKSGVATVSMYGIKEDVEYNVKVVATVTETIPCPVEKTEDATMAEGVEKVISKGTNGCRSIAYKYVYDMAGNLVSKTQLSADYYGTIAKKVKVGTKQVEVPTTPSVPTTPTAPTTPTIPEGSPTPSSSVPTSPSGTDTPGETGGENLGTTTTPSGSGITGEYN